MKVRPERAAESGKLLVEFAITIPFFLFVFAACFEFVNFLNQRQLAQSASREAALRAYKQCSGYSDTSMDRADSGVIERCLDEVAAAAVAPVSHRAPVANIGLFRCVGPRGGCVPTMIRAAGDVGRWTAVMGVAGDPFADLLANQRIVIVSNVEWEFTPLLAAFVPSVGFFNFSLGTVSDVTIL